MKKIIKKVQNHRLVAKYPTGVQMIKFAIVGGMNFIIDFSVYFSITRLSDFWREHYLWANVVAFCVAVTFSFFINKRWTFRCDKSGVHKQYVQFFVVCFMGLAWTELILYVGVDLLEWPALLIEWRDLIVKFIATFIVYFWNFGINKLWTFKAHRGEKL